jgi:hypothetical protein
MKQFELCHAEKIMPYFLPLAKVSKSDEYLSDLRNYISECFDNIYIRKRYFANVYKNDNHVPISDTIITDFLSPTVRNLVVNNAIGYLRRKK